MQLYLAGFSITLLTTYTISAQNTWEKKTISIPAYTTSYTHPADTAAGLTFDWNLSSGPDDIISPHSWQTVTPAARAATGQVNILDTVNNYWQLANVQYEVGEVSTPFEYLSYADELARCQRYFQFVEYAHAIARSSTNTGSVSARFSCEMRAGPTIGTMNLSTKATNVGLNLQGDGSVNTTQSSGNQGTSYSSQRSMYLYDMSGFGGMTAGRSYFVGVPANNAVVFTADAEL